MIRAFAWAAATFAVCQLLSAAPAGAAVRVKHIQAEVEGDNLILKVSLSGPLKPKVFSLNAQGQRPRVVIDFKGAKGAHLPARLKSPSPYALAVRSGRHPDKIRLVIDLVPGRVYKVEQWFRRDQNQYILILSAEDQS